MSAPYPTTNDVLVTALRMLVQMGAGETTPSPEDTQLALDTYNGIVGQWNSRRKFAWYQQSQAFTFGTSQQNYTIGSTQVATALNPTPAQPNFVVQEGERPENIDFAQLVLTDTPGQPTFIRMAVINCDQYQNIVVPALPSTFPLTMYYVRSWPLGTIIPYPAFPTSTNYQLNLTWWIQLTRVAIADIFNQVNFPSGCFRAITLTLAVAMSLMFPIKTNLEELKRQMREAVSDYQALNVKAPHISTDDGVGSIQDATFSWRSRQFI